MSPDRANVKVLPPVIPLAFAAAGLALHSVVRASIGPTWLARVAGILCITAAFALVIAAARTLRQNRTAFDVRKTTTALVTSGVYRLSRNPIYLAMMFLLCGFALAANSLIMLLLTVPAGSALCLLVIRPEEEYLHHKFGSSYSDYRRLARRWL